MSRNQKSISQGIDFTMVWLYAIMVSIGILCIFMVEYLTGTNWAQAFLRCKTNYRKQLIFAGVRAKFAVVILLHDTKFLSAFANVRYAYADTLRLATFV